MYYEYWGMQKAPFDNVPDPSMYVESHTSVENAVAETLFAIEEGNECIAVIVGDIGSGKTLSLRLILDSLEQDKYRIAFITNPDISFVHLLKEIIGQITGTECEARFKVDLLEHFNRLLFQTREEGKKVLIFIDEANALSPSNLESLRLLTNMQEDTQNLFTLVLAGQMELARRLEHPRRANLFQRIGTYNRIDKIESVQKLKDYVETRIRLAGGTQAIFTDGAIHALWEHSEHGVPRLVNKICKLCLKAGETNEFRLVEAETLTQIGQRFQKQIGPAERKEGRSKKGVVKPAVTSLEIVPAADEVHLADHQDEPHEASPLRSLPSKDPESSELIAEPKETSWETDIGPFRIEIAVPSDILQQAGASTSETRAKIAGSLAAQTLQKYPQMAFSPSHDPVALWGDIKKSILNAFDEHAIASGQ